MGLSNGVSDLSPEYAVLTSAIKNEVDSTVNIIGKLFSRLFFIYIYMSSLLGLRICQTGSEITELAGGGPGTISKCKFRPQI